MSQAITCGGKPSHILWLDICERAFVASLYAWLLYTVFEDVIGGQKVELCVFMIVEALIVAFVIGRRLAKETTTRPQEWVLAYLGSCLPLLVVPNDLDPLLPMAICVGLMLTGMFCQISGKLVLRRSFGIIPANRGVKIGGPYNFVRHPIYLGYTIFHIGFVLTSPSFWNVTIYAVTLIIQVARIAAEEQVLTKDRAYLAYTRNVRFRLLPGLF